MPNKVGWEAGDQDEVDAGVVEAKAISHGTALLAMVTGNAKTVDMLLYALFLIMFTAVAFNTQGGPTDATPFLTAENVRRKWGRSFDEIRDAAGWFDYMEHVFVPLTFPNAWYNGDPFDENDLGWPGGHPDMYRLIGEISARQVRVGAGSCSVRPGLEAYIPVCYGGYAQETEDSEGFGPISDGQPRFLWSSAADNGEGSYRGEAATYYGGGFRTGLPSAASTLTQEQAATRVRQLRDARWIDRQTRAVFVDMTLYNPANDLLLIVKLLAEFPPSGGVEVSTVVRQLRAEQLWPRGAGAGHIVLESFLLAVLLAYVGLEVRLVARMGAGAYFSRFWGTYDWLNFLLFFVSYGLRYQGLAAAAALPFPPEPGVYVSYEAAAWWVAQWKNVMAVNAFVTWLKAFKYLEAVPFMGHLIKVFYAAVPDTLGFLAAALCVFVGFTLAHLLAYGDAVGGYRTVSASMLTLYRQVLGDFEVGEMERGNRALGPALFVMWTLVTTVLLLNMFVAIVLDAYDKVRQQVDRVTLSAFLSQSALPPMQAALGRLSRLIGDADEPDDDGDAAAAAKGVLARSAAAEGGGDDDDGRGRGAGEGGMADEKLELVLQAVLTLSREVRVLSRRVKSLTETTQGGVVAPPQF